MARAQAKKDYIFFNKGLVTEANPLTYIDGASIDEANFVLNRDGSRQRRLGMDLEVSAAETITVPASTLSETVVTNHLWDTVENDPAVSLTVMQVNNVLYFFDASSASPSTDLVTTFYFGEAASGHKSNVGAYPLQSAVINGKIVFVSQAVEPFRVSYNSSTGTVSVAYVRPKIRDQFGENREGKAIDERPATLSSEHLYNLLNQGWTYTNVDAYRTSKSVVPADSDLMIKGKDGSGDFDPDLFDKQYFGTSKAPKGRFIIDAFDRGDSRYDEMVAAGVPGAPSLSDDVEKGRPSTVAAFAGRAFFSGVVSEVSSTVTTEPNYSNFLFYSRIVETPADLGVWYQEQDPSAEHLNVLLATDGGWIPIAEAKQIIKLVPLGNVLLIFAINGVWALGGGDRGFTAIDQQVYKVSQVGCNSPESIVDLNSAVAFWSNDGIYVLSPTTSGVIQLVNISEPLIETKYAGISAIAKKYAKGKYEGAAGLVRWLYNSDSSFTGASYVNHYDTELIYDLKTQAFFEYTLGSLSGTSQPNVTGYVALPQVVPSTISSDVVVGGDPVEVAADQVVISLSSYLAQAASSKYSVNLIKSSGTSSMSFAEYRDTDFLDWVSVDSTGANYSSYLVTGHEILDDVMYEKQVDEIVFLLKRTEKNWVDNGAGAPIPDDESSCLVQARWEWADHGNSGKYGTQFEAYRLNRPVASEGIGTSFDYGYDVIVTRNALRGSGRALSIRIDSSAGKNMHLLGWGVRYSAVNR